MNEPLATDNESIVLKVLLRQVCDIEFSPPTDRHSQAAWVTAIAQQLVERHPDLMTGLILPLVERHNAQMEAYRQRKLYNTKG